MQRMEAQAGGANEEFHGILLGVVEGTEAGA